MKLEKNKLKKRISAAILALSLVLSLTLSLAACGASDPNKPADPSAATESEAAAAAGTDSTAEDSVETAAAARDMTVIENDDMFLLVPNNFMDLLIIDTPADDPDGILFVVSEKASAEAAKAQGDDVEGAGWLFSIGTESEENVQEDFCGDMSGRDVFARAEDGSYFVWYHPTDVRFVREQYENIEEDQKQWTMLTEWGGSVKETFVKDNEGLTQERHSNTELDIYFARIAYKNDVAYTISSLENGEKEPGDTDPAPFVSRMINGVTFKAADSEEAPDGEYVVLTIPEDNVRYDFFFMDGKQNYVREVREGDGESYETLYEAVFENGTDTANGIMNEWYQALPGGEH